MLFASYLLNIFLSYNQDFLLCFVLKIVLFQFIHLVIWSIFNFWFLHCVRYRLMLLFFLTCRFVLTLFTEYAIFSPFKYLIIFVENHLPLYVWFYFCTLSCSTDLYIYYYMNTKLLISGTIEYVLKQGYINSPNCCSFSKLF